MNFLQNFEVLSRFTCVCTNRNLFRWTVFQKCRKINNCSLDYGSFIFQHPAIQTKIVQPLGGFFQQIKVRRPIGRTDSIQTASVLEILAVFSLLPLFIVFQSDNWARTHRILCVLYLSSYLSGIWARTFVSSVFCFCRLLSNRYLIKNTSYPLCSVSVVLSVRYLSKNIRILCVLFLSPLI